MGITLCAGDNGQVKIRRIAPNSVADKARHAIKEGDVIEKINGESMLGKAHREITAILKQIPLHSRFEICKSSAIQHSFIFSFQLRLISMPAISNATQNDNNKTMNCIRNGDSSPAFCQCNKLMPQVNKILADYYGFSRDETLTKFAIGLLYSSATLAEFKAKVGAEMASLDMPEHIIKQIWEYSNE